MIAVAAAAVFALSTGAAQAATINWSDFAAPDGSGPTFAPSAGDRIALQTESNVAPPGTIQVALRSAPWMTWRKGIELDRRARFCNIFTCWDDYQFFMGMYTQDGDHGGTPHTVPMGETNRGRLRFGKAQFLGIFGNNVYELPWDAAHAVSGRRYTFTWLRD